MIGKLTCDDGSALAVHRGGTVASGSGSARRGMHLCMASRLRFCSLGMAVTNVMDAQGKITGELPGLGK